MKRGIRSWGPGLLLVAPSMVAVAIFVYGLIGYNINISLSNRHSFAPATEYVGLDNYTELFGEDRFQHSLTNLATYTVVFLIGTMVFGLLWALLLERGVRGEGSSGRSTCSRWRSRSSPRAWCGAGCSTARRGRTPPG
jgi:ABC-type sugar transport systems, permease components